VVVLTKTVFALTILRTQDAPGDIALLVIFHNQFSWWFFIINSIWNCCYHKILVHCRSVASPKIGAGAKCFILGE